MPRAKHRHPLVGRLATICALLLGIAGCASAELTVGTGPPLAEDGYTGPPITIEYWNGFTGGDGPYMRAMVDEFNATHDKITVESNTLGWSDFYQRIVAAVHSGHGPDVAAMQLDNLATQAARSVIVPMQAAIKEMGFTAEDFPKTLVDATTFDGHTWGVPLDSHTHRVVREHRPAGQGRREQAGSHRRGLPVRAGVPPEGGLRQAVLDAEPLARAPDVPQPAVAERGRALLRGRHEGDVQQPRREWRHSPGWSTR